MNLILLEAGECGANGEVTLNDRRAVHIRHVLGASPGDRLRAGQLNGRTGSAEILELNGDRVRLHCSFDFPPPAKLPMTVIMALPRPKMLRRLLRTVAELGVPRLWLINTWKVEKSYWQSPLLDMDNCRRALLDGLEQARDTVLPEVHFRRLFKPFVEDELAAVMQGQPLVAHPAASQPCPGNLRGPATLVIGPEGGLTDYEYGRLLEHGFQGVNLGQRILRVETALTALTSRLYEPR